MKSTLGGNALDIPCLKLIMKAKEYLTFTKRERNGILALLVIMAMVVVAPKYLCQSSPVERITAVNFDKNVYEVRADTSGAKAQFYPHSNSNHQRAGPDRYGKKRIQPFDINTGDTTAFIALPGIGSKLALRIVTFRDKLGGFLSVSQIAEVYGLKDSVFQIIKPYLKCDVNGVHKIEINIAARDELKNHPYIRWSIADAIVSYRDQHGPFTSAADFRKIESVDAEALEKMMPYISFK